ncbi:hypothetical protein EV1_046777 [Malus domestica]
MEPKANELPKGLVLGKDENIHIRLRESTPLDDNLEKAQIFSWELQLVSLTFVTFDTYLYGGTDKAAYVLSIPVNDDDDNAQLSVEREAERRRGGWGFGASESSPSSQSFYISATGGVSSLNLDCSSATGGDVEDTGGLSCSSSWLP